MSTSSPPAGVEVSYQLTERDFAALQDRYDRRRTSALRRNAYWVFVVLAVAYGVWLLWQPNARGAPDYSTALLILGLVLVMLAARFVLGPFAVRRRFRASKMGQREVHLSADGDYLRLDFGDSDSRTAWSNFDDSERTADHFFFWLDRHQAVIVPLRAFSDEAERERLWALATGKTVMKNG
jgi:hypothetical protein